MVNFTDEEEIEYWIYFLNRDMTFQEWLKGLI